MSILNQKTYLNQILHTRPHRHSASIHVKIVDFIACLEVITYPHYIEFTTVYYRKGYHCIVKKLRDLRIISAKNSFNVTSNTHNLTPGSAFSEDFEKLFSEMYE